MFIKVYFNEKPLFLCDSLEDGIESYLQQHSTIFIDSFSLPAVTAIIDEMTLPATKAGVFLHSDISELQAAFWKAFTLVKAGGGLVVNQHQELLLIFRRGMWDLPKGKLDDGETIEQCALREVEEETGLQDIGLGSHLLTTYHTYHERNESILKESHWYNMSVYSEQQLVPQAAEQITEARWVATTDVAILLHNTFPSVKDVLTAGLVIRH